MNRWIITLTLLQIPALLSFNAPSANTAAIQTGVQISQAELTKKFDDILDKELAGENVCITPSAARRLHALMTNSAAKIITAKAFNRVGEAEQNIRVFAKVLRENGTQQSGATKITVDTIDNVVSQGVEPPTNVGGGGSVRDVFCPLFPIC